MFTSNIDLAPLDRATLLAKSNCHIEEKVDEIYVASHRYPKSGLDGNRYCIPGYENTGHQRLKAMLCRRFLRIIDVIKIIPAFFAIIPLRLCEKEIIGGLLAFDPDVVGVLNLRWGRLLQKLIRRHYPQWACTVDPDERLEIVDQWRKYDPLTKVSIVLPTYNGTKYLRQSIQSCLNQSHRNIELLIVDDGSAENTVRIVKHHDDSRIKYFRHDKNRGIAEALNTGFRNSTGDYLTWTSDDNYYAENAIETMVRFLQTYPEVDFVYAARYVIGAEHDGRVRRVIRPQPPAWLKVNNGVGACFLYKHKVYEALGDYNTKVSLAEDYEYWVRVSRQFRMQHLHQPLYYYRFHDGSLTGKHSHNEVLERVKLVKEMHGI